MTELNLIRIIASTIYFLITLGILWMLVRDLKSGMVQTWMRGYPKSRPILKRTLPKLEKYEQQGAVQGKNLIFYRDKFPKEYWNGIFLRVMMFIIMILLGFNIYSKLF